MATEHSDLVRQLNDEKELLISQNCELKKEVAQTKFDQDMLKSQVEGYHAKMQTLQAELQKEQKHVARIKACSGDLTKLEEELKFSKDKIKSMTDKVQETHENMQREQAVVEETL